MGKEGYWTYWFKAPDGFDILFANNKKDIPLGYKYVQHFKVEKTNGVKDWEIIENGKTVWIRKNVHKMSECERLQMSHDVQREIHKLLSVGYPEKEYKKLFEKKVKGCKLNNKLFYTFTSNI